MSAIENELLSALLELEAASANPAAHPPGGLLALFARIDRLAAQLPPDSDAELRHFLQRKSYQKARQRLQGANAARGACGA